MYAIEHLAYNYGMWSVVLYGSETWSRRKEDIKRLEAFEIWTGRRMEKSSLIEHSTIEEELTMIVEESLATHNKKETKKMNMTLAYRRIMAKSGYQGIMK